MCAILLTQFGNARAGNKQLSYTSGPPQCTPMRSNPRSGQVQALLGIPRASRLDETLLLYGERGFYFFRRAFSSLSAMQGTDI
jgi:hypothetical protein